MQVLVLQAQPIRVSSYVRFAILVKSRPKCWLSLCGSTFLLVRFLNILLCFVKSRTENSYTRASPILRIATHGSSASRNLTNPVATGTLVRWPKKKRLELWGVAKGDRGGDHLTLRFKNMEEILNAWRVRICNSPRRLLASLNSRNKCRYCCCCCCCNLFRREPGQGSFASTSKQANLQ